MDLGNFFLVHVNFLAVLLSGVAAMAIGFVWYGPLFGKQWMKLIGKKSNEKLQVNQNMTQTYAIMFGASLLMAYVLAHFVWYAAPGSLTIFISVKTAVWAWLGFVATFALTKFLFTTDRKPWSLYAIETGYYLATLVVMGIILALLP